MAPPDILERIDAATDGLCACGCQAKLDPQGPSAYWATERCQMAWQAGEDPHLQAARARTAARIARQRVARAAIRVGATTTLNREAVANAVADAEAAFRNFGEDLARLAQAWADHMKPALAQMAEVARQLRATGIITDEPPTDPMQRALWLRKNRNTGPSPKPRVPRRIDPRRAR